MLISTVELSVARRSSAFWLRVAFMVGAVTDAAALVPMLCPSAAKIMWGIDASAAGYWFAMGYAAALMVGWTFLLIWAFLKPCERRMVAVLTMVVIVGLAVTEIVTAASGLIDVGKVVPTLILQSILLGLFVVGYFKSRSR
ncbi:MAG: hypothetical protein FWF36_03245 [Propionibacteriaceae bacterium]|nr:hypothetical protein [Propionibacteriaceae bacterium]